MCRGLSFIFYTRIASGHNDSHCVPPAIVCRIHFHLRSKDEREKFIFQKKYFECDKCLFSGAGVKRSVTRAEKFLTELDCASYSSSSSLRMTVVCRGEQRRTMTFDSLFYPSFVFAQDDIYFVFRRTEGVVPSSDGKIKI